MLVVSIFELTDPALIAITIDAVQNILSHSSSSKCILFGSTVDMAEDELKTKSKAVADLIGIELNTFRSVLVQSLIFISYLYIY